MSDVASAVIGSSTPAEINVTKKTADPAAPESASFASRGRVRDADGPDMRQARSRSRLRRPKLAGSKLKGMVKDAMRKMSNRSSYSDVSSRTSTDDNLIALNNDSGGKKVAAIGSIFNSTGGASAAVAASAMPEPALELVVLILDPVSRRFELLQLEFDSWRAKVSDLLTQIPLSVTEPALQEKPYVGVLDFQGSLQEGGTRLMEAFGGVSASSSPSKKEWPPTKLVLVAKPKGLSTKETMRLAKPILTSTQVSKMVSVGA